MKKKKGRKLKEQPIFENEAYRITKVPLNYQIECKVIVKTKKGMVKLIGDYLYSDLGRGLEEAKATAEYMIHHYQNSFKGA